MLDLKPEFFDGILSIKQIICYILIAASAFICAYFVYPIIIYLSHLKHLSATPNERSSHKYETPILGGAGIFIGFIMSAAIGLFLFHPDLNLLTLIAIFISSFILFVVGLKDDIIPTKAINKLGVEILVCGFIIFLTKTKIMSLQGIFGIYELPYIVSLLFSIFVFVVIINAFNLIDGIDGLAGLQSLILTLVFGFYFALNNRLTLTLLACALGGAIFAFLFYNLSTRRKIFMGDSGSIFVGLLLAYFSLAALKTDTTGIALFKFKNSAVIVMSLLSYPLLDTLRVFTIRIYNKRSPFSPDRNHIHHILIDLGLSHRRASICISLFTLIIFGISLSLSHLDINLHLAIMTAILATFVIGLLVSERLHKKTSVNETRMV